MDKIPNSGSTTSGKKAVAEMGMASVIHQIAIQAARANMVWALVLKSGESTKKYSPKKAKGPRKRPRVGTLIFIEAKAKKNQLLELIYMIFGADFFQKEQITLGKSHFSLDLRSNVIR